jgi:hypothetical protein
MTNTLAGFSLLSHQLCSLKAFRLPNWRIPKIKQSLYAQAPFDLINIPTFADTNNFKLRFLYYHGMQPNSAGFVYPYGSSDNLSVDGPPLSNVNLSLTPGATDFQPLQYYYNFLLNSKPFEMGFMLNKKQLFDLRANKRILISDFNRATISCILDQVAADLKEMQDSIATKITLYPKIWPDNALQPVPPVVVPPVTPPFDNGLVYLRFTEVNQTEIVETVPTSANSFFKDLVVSFFADAAGTMPKNVVDLRVGYSTTETDNFGSFTVIGPTFAYVNCNGTTFNLRTAAPIAENFTDGSGWTIVWVYAVLSSAYYTIIP